ncbi:MAG: hypothetical protein QOG31_1133 [Thermoplasmata archaeon]|jgi:hypothetical protein|nr:hypothetical protein [Thermoplasmata archaeon]
MGDDHVLRCDCCGEVRLWPPLAGVDMSFLAGKRCLSHACYSHRERCEGRYRPLEGSALAAVRGEVAALPGHGIGPEGWQVRPPLPPEP